MGRGKVLESIKQANIGSVVPVYKEIDTELDALDYFKMLSNNGSKKNSLLMESAEKSFGTSSPCLIVSGKNDEFEIAALNNLGKKFLNFIKKDFKFCDKAIYSKGKIHGTLTPPRNSGSGQERLKLKTHMDIIRVIAFKFTPTSPLLWNCGMFGMVSNDFINLDLPKNEENIMKDPDYIFYFLDNMFIVDHKAKKTYFAAYALITDSSKEKTFQDCNKIINNNEKIIDKKPPKGKKPKKKDIKPIYDVDKEEFIGLMRNLKRHIIEGDILFAVPSRTATTNFNLEPIDIYSQLKEMNPGFTSCYINDNFGTSISSGASSFFTVSENNVELNIYTNHFPGTKDDNDMDDKYEALLRVDENEISYNMMLLDSARNDVSRISKPGTRHVDKFFNVEKLAGFQYLASSVKGILRDDYDAIHAYLATTNPSVISGIPKIKSLELLEKTKRSLTNSSIVYISPSMDLLSMTTSPIRIKKDKAFFNESTRVFQNSDEKKEIDAAEKRTECILNAVSGESK